MLWYIDDPCLEDRRILAWYLTCNLSATGPVRSKVCDVPPPPRPPFQFFKLLEKLGLYFFFLFFC